MAENVGFHAGEREVQERAGVRLLADRYEGMLLNDDLDGAAGFLAQQTFAVLAGRDADDRLWTSALIGEPGFLDARGGMLDIRTAPRPGDPLAGVATGQPVGLIAITFATRRRFRINGTLIYASATRLRIAVDQAYGNCPKYIHARTLEPVFDLADGPVGSRPDPPQEGPPDGEERALIDRAVTLFLGTTHPDRGVDASHRGGPPGFLRRDGDDLWWPDYLGNNMFNSLGNLSVDPTAAVLVADYATGRALHATGTARTDWVDPDTPGDDGHTGRIVRFTPLAWARSRLPVRETAGAAFPRNPPVS